MKKSISSMLAAASLFAVSACGSVLAPPTGTDDTDSGTGSADVSMSCESASECSDGAACDLEARQCVTDALTIDNTDLVNDGLRTWTASSGPKLVGSYQGSSDAVIQVKVAAGAPIAATTDGSRWSVQLAPGAILETDTLVTVTLTDPGQGVVELEQAFALDGAAPVIALGTSKVRDERGDVITFEAEGPVHDHQGNEIDLADGGCPVVYKYAYLMDTAAPAHGGETVQNAIVWNTTVEDTKVVAVEYRVIDAQNAIVRDWMAVPGNGSAYPMALVRDGATGIAAAAETAGKYTIEVRARDWGDRVSSASYCIDLKPLAAPLKIEQPVIATGSDGLSGWSLVANSPVSRITKPGVGAAVVEQKLVQYSSERVFVNLSIPAPQGTWRAQFLAGWVPSSSERVVLPCSSYNCQMLDAPTPTSYSGNLASAQYQLQLVDANGLVVPNSGISTWTIPARAPGAGPVAYSIRLRMSNVALYSGYTYNEYQYDTLAYTGTAATQTTVACSEIDSFNTCRRRTTYQYIFGLNTVGVSMNPFSMNVAVAASALTQFALPPHVSAATFVTPTLNWDGGDESSY